VHRLDISSTRGLSSLHINSQTLSPSKPHMLITHIQGGSKREREREKEESYRKSISSGKQITDRLGGEKRECNDGCQKRGTMTVIMAFIFRGVQQLPNGSGKRWTSEYVFLQLCGIRSFTLLTHVEPQITRNKEKIQRFSVLGMYMFLQRLS